MAIYSELVNNQGISHCHLYFGTASKIGRWMGSGKKGSFSYALIKAIGMGKWNVF